MIIAQISDTHIINPKANIYYKLAKNRVDNLERCVSNILNLETLPDAIIHTGDISHNGKVEEYELAHNILNKLNIPIFYTPGNRDNRKNLRSILNDPCLKDNNHNYFIYSETLNNFKIISLDTKCEGSNLGKLNHKTLDIFSKILIENKNIPTIVFMHHPPYNVSTTSKKYIEYTADSILKEFIEVLKSYDNILGLFSGHIHRNFETSISNIMCYTSPPIALDLSRDKRIKPEMNNIQYLLHSYSKKTGIFTEKILVQ